MSFLPSRHISDIPFAYPWEHPPRSVAAAPAPPGPAATASRGRRRWLPAAVGALIIGLLAAGCSSAQPATTGPLSAGEPQAGGNPRVVEDIRELRERFGLPGYTGSQDYYAVLDPETADWDEQKFDDYFREYHAKVRHDWPRSDVEKLVDAVDHVIDLVGVDHVGIASDFHHGGGIDGWLGYPETPRVTEALRRRHGDDEVAKIWGGNLLRVWSEARALAGR